MRTNIVLDDSLVKEAFLLSGVKTKKDLISLALKEFVMTRKRRNLLELAGKIDADNRICFIPVPFVIHKQALEQLFSCFKQTFQRIQKQGFAEPPGPGKKIVFAGIGHFQGQGGLVDIDVVVFSDFRKILYTQGKLFHTIAFRP